jgi:Toprim-like/MCM P-loop domain
MRSARKLLEPYLAGGYERENGDLDLHCPIHGDKRRSATVNFKTKVWYCNSCEEGGHLDGLIARRAEWHPAPLTPGGSNIKQGRKLPLPDSARMDGWQAALMGNESLLEFLEIQRGLTMDTIQRYGLGWDGKRYTIPVYDDKSILRNVRCYSNILEQKMINWPGHGSPPRLFPMSVLLDDPKTVWICEGEFDALLANQQGVAAVTGTGGVKSTGRGWRADWSEWFKGKSVFVCFDRDKDGDLNTRRVIEKLKRFARKVQYVELPFPMGSGKDVSDYILDGGSLSALRKSAKNPKAVKKAKPRYRIARYNDLRQGDSIGKPMELEATLASVHSSQLSLPIVLKANCNIDWDPKRCSMCPMSQKNGKMSQDVRFDHNLHLDLLGIGKSDERERRFKKEMKIPINCSMVEIDADNMSAWDAEIRNGSNHAEQAFPLLIFTDSDMPDHVNHLYRWRGIPMAAPRGSRTIFIAREHESAKQDLDNFEPDEKGMLAAKEWVSQFGDKPEEQVDQIAAHFEDHATRIRGQRLLHIAMDLVYHSVLNFKFGDQEVGRGWMEALVVGDTRSGKSTTAQALQDLYGYGEIKSGENTTVAGLIGGLETRSGLTKDGSWAVTAGELPLCDRRLLVLDEAQGLPVKDIGMMSDVRSRGLVDITKIRRVKVPARVRLIWLANKRGDIYKNGVDALVDQMGKEEDLARIDIPLYMTANIGEEQIAKTRVHTKDLPDEERAIISWIVLWAWSRRSEQIFFSPAAEEAVHDLATNLAEEYSTVNIPIFPPLEARIRLARISVALATRLVSTPDGHRVTVRAGHVVGAYELYRRFFNDPTLGIVDIKEEEVSTEQAAESHSKDLAEFLNMVNPEIVHKMALGEFRGIAFGAQSENETMIAQLSIWRAIWYNKQGNLSVHKWAQEVAKEVEKERFG